MSFTTFITPAELEMNLNNPDWVIVDCRFDLMKPDWGYAAYQAAHIPGAIYAHMDHDLSGPLTPQSGRHPLPDPHHFIETLGNWGIDSSKQVVVVDSAAGSFAARLWWMLRQLNHTAVAVLEGGFPRWGYENRPVRSGIEKNSSVQCDLTGTFHRFLSSDQMASIINDPTWRIIDARALERYRGEQEPIDPVAGHIPSAVNRPHTANLASGGHFLPAGELRSQFLSLLDGIPPERTVVYCGSGVTSCFHLIAMEIAGLPGGWLYAGSWSEWIRDPNRPIHTGNQP